MTRYFMTIPEAAQLVIQAGAMGQGGDVFLLDMGSPVKIYDLACKMIRLSGLTLYDPQTREGDIEIKTTGTRPGEKLYEELLIGGTTFETRHPPHQTGRRTLPDPYQNQNLISEIRGALKRCDPLAVRQILARAIPSYKPSAEIIDLTATSQIHQLPTVMAERAETVDLKKIAK